MLSLLLLLLFITLFYIYNINESFSNLKNDNFPKIVHLIYFPWNSKNGILKDDENDFNHSFYQKFKNSNPNYEIKLWTLSKIKKFTNQYYPEFNNIWDFIKHPVQSVDFFRLLVVYHFGGIYWQYESKQICNLEKFTPSKNKNIKLFVEIILDKNLAESKKHEPIRKGKPEELIRIATQCYAAYPKNSFIKYCIDKSWKNLNNLIVKSQYDILYIGGNAMISEAFDQFDDKNKIELIYDTNKYIHFSSNGSWRLKSYN